MGTNPGENAPLKRGDFGDGESLRLAFTVEFLFGGACDCSERLLFRDLVREVSKNSA